MRANPTNTHFGDFSIARILFQRALAAIYLIAFIVVLKQFPALLGEHGLLPVSRVLNNTSFLSAPSIFHLGYSDRLLTMVAWAGIVLSTALLFGLSEKTPVWISMAAWLTLWALYLSIVNVGQTFYAFGWESMLLEAGFFAAFLGPAGIRPSLIPILILRWMLFRTELGSGLIKLKAGGCWHDLTCLYYHHETQPMPNPFSWYFHHLPKEVHRLGVVFSHFVQVIVPFALFGPQWIAAVAGSLIIGHQMFLIVSGNYSWLNWLTVFLGFTAFSDSTLAFLRPAAAPATAERGPIYNGMLYALAAAVVLLSIQPVLNLLSRNQVMNYSFNKFHLVNTYGAFGSVTKERYEIVIEGTQDEKITPETQWQAYDFKGKPVDPNERPPQIAPYHLRLDWLMWFLPFNVRVTEKGIVHYGYERWFVKFIQKLLEGDSGILKLLGSNPFPGKPPHFIRAQFYRYQFTTVEERMNTGAWWKRTLIDDYLPPVTISDLQ